MTAAPAAPASSLGARILATRLGALAQILDGCSRLVLPGRAATALRQRARHELRKLRARCWRRLIAVNAALRDRHADRERCFVIGAGPSLKNLDLAPLRNEIWFGVNYVHFHPELRGERTRGNYFVILNPFVYAGEELAARIGLLQAADERIPEAELIFPVAAERICREHGLFAGRRIHYVTWEHWLDPDETIYRDRLDLDSVLPQPYNTLETAIIAAAYMGFKEIILLGCDVDYVNQPEFRTMHFYSIEDALETFDVGRRPNPMGDWNTLTVRLGYSFRVFQALGLLGRALACRGVRIYNASGGGMLDVFPCISYESLFAKFGRR